MPTTAPGAAPDAAGRPRRRAGGAGEARRSARRPRPAEIDWHRTIRANLRHYQAEQRTVIPETLIGHARRRNSLRDVVLLVDQSGSMASSVVYSGVLGAALVGSGVQVVALLALSDAGAPSFDARNAAALAALGVPCFACTPEAFPELLAAAIRRTDVAAWAAGRGFTVARAGA